MTCKYCGYENGIDAIYCDNCGSSLLEKDLKADEEKITEKKKKMSGSKKAVIVCIVICIILAVVCAFILINIFREKPVSVPELQTKNHTTSPLTELRADNYYLAEISNNNIVFTVKSSRMDGKIFLYSGKTKLSEMRDNGKNGDEKAGDGIYTATEKVNVGNVSSIRELKYCAKSDNFRSNDINLYAFSIARGDDAKEYFETFRDIAGKLKNIESKNYGEDGFVAEKDIKKVYEEAEELLAQEKKNKNVLLYEKDDGGIYIKFTSGISMIFEVGKPGFDAIGKDVKVSVCSYDTGKYNSDTERLKDFQDNSANNLSKVFTNYVVTKSLDNSEVTLQEIKNFKSNSVILWHGHGIYKKPSSVSNVNSALVTGEDISDNIFNSLIDYITDRCVVTADGKIAVTSGFIDNYCSDLSNSFVYLASCRSGYSQVLPKSFMKKGAACVIANSDNISTQYNITMMRDIIDNMATVNEKTKNYYTVYEAVQLAKQRNDENDKNYGGVGAFPVIYGNSDVYDFRFGDYVKETTTAKQPATTKKQEAKWQDVYKDFLINKKFLTRTDSVFFPDRHSQDDYDINSLKISLRDLDGNYIPELIMSNGANSMVCATNYVFTVNGNSVVYLGDVGSADNALTVDSTGKFPGIYCVKIDNMGIFPCTYYYVSYGKVRANTIFAEYTDKTLAESGIDPGKVVESIYDERLGVNLNYVKYTDDDELYNSHKTQTELKYFNLQQINQMGMNSFISQFS